jgi:hypothetical protein
MPSKHRAIDPPNIPSFETMNQGIPDNQLYELESYKNVHLSNKVYQSHLSNSL